MMPPATRLVPASVAIWRVEGGDYPLLELPALPVDLAGDGAEVVACLSVSRTPRLNYWSFRILVPSCFWR
jgi:hypothetical protein